MRIFETENNLFKLIVYNKLDASLINRHHGWCKTKKPSEKAIYMVFILQDPEDIKWWRSNRLDNRFCLVYTPHKYRDDDWLAKFCDVSYSQEYVERTRSDFRFKD